MIPSRSTLPLMELAMPSSHRMAAAASFSGCAKSSRVRLKKVGEMAQSCYLAHLFDLQVNYRLYSSTVYTIQGKCGRIGITPTPGAIEAKVGIACWRNRPVIGEV